MGSRGVFQPVGQKRLTNIAVVRLKKAGQRFEIACYKNKVQDWRSGIEKDLDEVLQSTTVFSNVSKGVVAKDKDLQAAFGTTDQQAICLEILARGELQVGEEERKLQYDNLFKDVASVLTEKCINPDSGRPYTLALIERALRDVHFSVDPKRSAKQQALEALPMLQAKFPIQRARMRLKLSVPTEAQEALLEELDGKGGVVESTDMAAGGNTFIAIAQVDPGVFRELHTFMQQGPSRGKGRMEVLSFAVMAEGSTADEFAAPPAGPSASAPSWQQSQQQPGVSLQQHQQQQSQASASALGSAMESLRIGGAAPAAGLVASPSRAQPSSSRGGGVAGAGAAAAGEVVYKGSIAGIPEAHAQRKERFSELDNLQPGWEVELRTKGDTVEAVFFAPGTGECVGPFANARRAALAAKKAAGGS